MMNIAAFDADGVFMDSRKAHGRLMFDYADEFGHTIPEIVLGRPVREPNDVWRAMRSPMDAVFRDFGFPEEIIPTLMKRYRADLPNYDLQAYPRVISAIRRLDLKAGVVTSNYRSVIEQFLKKLGVEDTFQYIVGLEDVPMPKPDPTSLELCLKNLSNGSSPSEAYMFGDSKSDLRTVRNLNDLKKLPYIVKSVAVGFGFNEIQDLQSEDPDVSLESEEDFEKFLSTLNE